VDDNVIRKLIEIYGENHQLLKLVEEMSELQKEILKYVTKYMQAGQSFECTEEREKIIEEMADVEMTLEQCKYIFGILFSELEKVKKEKLERLGV
jgi:seryl-tRNA synthetase